MRKHGGTPSRRDKHVTLAAISPPGVARGRFVGGQQSGLAGCKPPPLSTRGASSCSSQGDARGNHGDSLHDRVHLPTYLTYIRTTDLSSFQTLAHGILKMISFWPDHQKQFPTLYVMAGQWFAPSATSASSERTFSGFSHLVSRRRAKQSPEHVELLIFVRSNMQYFPDFGPLEDQSLRLYFKKKGHRGRGRGL